MRAGEILAMAVARAFKGRAGLIGLAMVCSLPSAAKCGPDSNRTRVVYRREVRAELLRVSQRDVKGYEEHTRDRPGPRGGTQARGGNSSRTLPIEPDRVAFERSD